MSTSFRHKKHCEKASEASHFLCNCFIMCQSIWAQYRPLESILVLSRRSGKRTATASLRNRKNWTQNYLLFKTTSSSSVFWHYSHPSAFAKPNRLLKVINKFQLETICLTRRHFSSFNSIHCRLWSHCVQIESSAC